LLTCCLAAVAAGVVSAKVAATAGMLSVVVVVTVVAGSFVIKVGPLIAVCIPIGCLAFSSLQIPSGLHQDTKGCSHPSLENLHLNLETPALSQAPSSSYTFAPPVVPFRVMFDL
jgi:hypothetical protein